MIKFNNVTFVYPEKDLYDDISFEIEQGEHYVLIGSNGAGKSTLVKLITDHDEMTYEGSIETDPDMRIAVVEQFVDHIDSDMTAYDYLAEPFITLQGKIDSVCAEMASEDTDMNIFDRYQDLLDEMDSVDGYNYDSNIHKELALAGIDKIADVPVSKISGGEFKLLSIIRSMLMKPQLLIMDEPDVFLDFDNLVGLTKLINSYDGTVLAITHNRLLLNQCFDNVLHIEGEKLQQFPGTFAEYNRALLETRIDTYEHRARFDDYIDYETEFIGKLVKDASEFASPKKGKQIKARKSYLERIMQMRGDYPFIDCGNYDFTLPEIAEIDECVDETETVMPDGDIIKVTDYELAYDRPILSDVNFEISAGDKISIIGANGTGKSSLLGDLHHMLKDRYGDSVELFSQVYDNCDDKMSGGERNIRQIERICDTEASILLLDEPTSHLDIFAQTELERALGEYKGTVIMVTHDFYMVNSCSDRIFLLENGTMRETSGRAYRKSVYKKYFDSDVFQQERDRKLLEIRVNKLLESGDYKEAREALESSDV